MIRKASLPYWRLSTFYFLYFSSLGALLLNWPLFLNERGLSPSLIALLAGSLAFGKIIISNLWAWLADHYGKPITVVRIALVGAVLSFGGIFFVVSPLIITILSFSFGCFWSAILPQFETTTLNRLGQAAHSYTRIRLWGSVGFISTVLLLSFYYGELAVTYVPLIVSGILLCLFFAVLSIPDNIKTENLLIDQQSFTRVLKNPAVLALLGGATLVQMSHAGYYTFFSMYLKTHHYSHGQIGTLWTIGVVSEIFIFMHLKKLIARFGIERLLVIATVLTTLRWLLTAIVVDRIVLLAMVQTLHAGSFAVYHGCAVQLIHKHFRGRLQGRGQAIYNSLTYGLGLFIGSLIAGSVWENFGSKAIYYVSGIMSLGAFFIATRRVLSMQNQK